MTRLVGDPAVQTAARVARRFSLDPVAVLADADPLHWAVRVAAYAVTVEDDKENARRNKR